MTASFAYEEMPDSTTIQDHTREYFLIIITRFVKLSARVDRAVEIYFNNISVSTLALSLNATLMTLNIMPDGEGNSVHTYQYMRPFVTVPMSWESFSKHTYDSRNKRNITADSVSSLFQRH